MTWKIALRLGRVSNLPTVWTNVLAGVVLAGGTIGAGAGLLLILALSLFYVAGMFLNDAFDREIDARERPERPIPSGAVTARAVFLGAFAMMAAGLVLLVVVGYGVEGGTGWRPAAGGVLLGLAIVLYDWNHKGNALSPVLMGLCRLLVYFTAGVAVTAALPGALVVAALVALAYLIGLTYVAKHESGRTMTVLWPLAFLAVPFVYAALIALETAVGAGLFLLFLAWIVYALTLVLGRNRRVPRAVGHMLAGICLLDAIFIAGQGDPGLALLAAVGFPLTLLFQRVVPGT